MQFLGYHGRNRKKKNGSTDVDDDNPAFRIVGQISKYNIVSNVNEGMVELFSIAIKVRDPKAVNVLRQSLKDVLQKDGTLTVSDDELLCRKSPTDKAKQIIVLYRYRRTLLYHRQFLTLVGHP